VRPTVGGHRAVGVNYSCALGSRLIFAFLTIRSSARCAANGWSCRNKSFLCTWLAPHFCRCQYIYGTVMRTSIRNIGTTTDVISVERRNKEFWTEVLLIAVIRKFGTRTSPLTSFPASSSNLLPLISSLAPACAALFAQADATQHSICIGSLPFA
jgi:hypothetical protein